MAKKPAADDKRSSKKPKRRPKKKPVSSEPFEPSDYDIQQNELVEHGTPEDLRKSTNGVEHVREIIINARATWFALLGALVFASVTLFSVTDTAFFLDSVETKLPLVGISVPVSSFFGAGSLLITLLYIYFHLYLEQLWEALGEASAKINDRPLADHIHPWLVSDAALRLRDSIRENQNNSPSVTEKDKFDLGSARRRGMSWVSNLMSVVLVWFFAPIVIGWFWVRSAPAQNVWLTTWLALLLFASLSVFRRSGYYAFAKLGGRSEEPKQFYSKLFSTAFYVILFGVLSCLTIFWTSMDIFAGEPRQKANYLKDFLRPARAELAETIFTQKPEGWLGKKFAEQEFRVRWCKEMLSNPCKINPFKESDSRFLDGEEKAFQTAWNSRWKASINALKRPDLRNARLINANLERAAFESANLTKARLEDSILRGAVLDSANLWGASLRRANLYQTDLQNSNMRGTRLQNTVLRETIFTSADMTSSILSGARLIDTNLKNAILDYARLSNVTMERANLNGASFRFARIEGHSVKPLKLKESNFQDTRFTHTFLRHLDFTDSNLNDIDEFLTSFGDGSVRLPVNIRRPSHWCATILNDAQFYGRWRGRIETYFNSETFRLGIYLSKAENRKYPAIHPFTPCPGAHHLL